MTWGSHIFENEKPILDIRNNESVNMKYYHQNSFLIDENLSYFEMAIKKYDMAQVYLLEVIQTISRISMEDNGIAQELVSLVVGTPQILTLCFNFYRNTRSVYKYHWLL